MRVFSDTVLSDDYLGFDSSLKKLSMASTAKHNPTEDSIVDNWEDEEASSSSDTLSQPSTPVDNHPPGPPPPTPISPTSSHGRHRSTDRSAFNQSQTRPAPFIATSASPTRASGLPEKRPEKSSAAAGRMIAGALGVKVPKKTEEGRRYEKAVRENERMRREKVREEEKRVEREKQEARESIWAE